MYLKCKRENNNILRCSYYIKFTFKIANKNRKFHNNSCIMGRLSSSYSLVINWQATMPLSLTPLQLFTANI